MEILAIISAVLVLTIGGIALKSYLDIERDFFIFSSELMGAATVTMIVWILAYFFYEPGSADAMWIEILAGLLILVAGVCLPVWLLVQDIRGGGLFWGPIAFLYQLLAVITVVFAILSVAIRLNEKR